MNDQTQPILETVEVETGPEPTVAIIWLHGLGADGHDFEPLVPELVLPGGPNVRFVFPHAPVRPVTINGGRAMRAWFDILALDREAAQDEAGISEARGLVETLIEREKRRGIPADRLILAGFSQGGAIALYAGTRHPERLAGIIGLSCYLPLMSSQKDEAAEANADVPIFLVHGIFDAILPLARGESARDGLRELDYDVEWHEYRMSHAVCNEEVEDLRAWLSRTLGSA